MFIYTREQKIEIIDHHLKYDNDDPFCLADFEGWEKEEDLDKCNTEEELIEFSKRLYNKYVAVVYVTPRPYYPSIKQRLYHFFKNL